ncbi:hypothetical protein AQUCO_00600063v1 [Aquilegia coerulea]|uniref:Uncharacterized protein n=1 Tax=Aquilegia coerulea TaxID=218851 RepID=A0A2G5EMS4_AQUCA|nr:hypothetical protein AQUCO_00600063v1 [Aquilegia coerulea]
MLTCYGLFMKVTKKKQTPTDYLIFKFVKKKKKFKSSISRYNNSSHLATKQLKGPSLNYLNALDQWKRSSFITNMTFSNGSILGRLHSRPNTPHYCKRKNIP